MVMTRGLAELTRLGVAMGGEAPTFAGLAGMGDLVTTCLSPFSRNRSVGEQLGARPHGWTRSRPTMNMVAEGLKTAVTAHELAERFGLDMPVHEEIYQVVTGTADAADAYRGLRRRSPATSRTRVSARPSPRLRASTGAGHARGDPAARAVAGRADGRPRQPRAAARARSRSAGTRRRRRRWSGS